MTDDLGFTEKYWICDQCADDRKWEAPKYAVTGIFGKCGWCRKQIDEPLIPTCDYRKPGQPAPAWD